MVYSLRAGGKRLRPILMLEVYKVLAGNDNIEEVMPFAASIEMIHTYSLIHDDLPAMDNDDFRRGKATNHKVFGEGIAILAGDGLLNFAFEKMIEGITNYFPNDDRGIRAMYEIARASGINGMIGGQVADLESEGKRVDKDTLKFIHLKKTSAMIEAAVKTGAIIGNASEEQFLALSKYASAVGLAFQVVDDILDVIGDENKLGKKIGSDINNDKSTYPSLYGIEESKIIANKLIGDSINALNIFGQEADFLRVLAKYLEIREN